MQNVYQLSNRCFIAPKLDAFLNESIAPHYGEISKLCNNNKNESTL
jgi:hypothetical protein